MNENVKGPKSFSLEQGQANTYPGEPPVGQTIFLDPNYVTIYATSAWSIHINLVVESNTAKTPLVGEVVGFPAL